MALPLIPIAMGLANVVPGLLRLLKGDQAGDVADKVLGVAKSLTGLDDPEEAVKAVQMDPALQIRMKELALEEINAFLADRQDARKREIDIVKATGKRDYFLYGLAALVVLGYFALCGILMRYPLPAGSNEVVFMLFGGLAAGFGSVLQYFFGSSKSSSDKTALLSQK